MHTLSVHHALLFRRKIHFINRMQLWYLTRPLKYECSSKSISSEVDNGSQVGQRDYGPTRNGFSACHQHNGCRSTSLIVVINNSNTVWVEVYLSFNTSSANYCHG